MKAAFTFSLLFGAASGVQAACATTPAASVLDIEMCWADYYARPRCRRDYAAEARDGRGPFVEPGASGGRDVGDHRRHVPGHSSSKAQLPVEASPVLLFTSAFVDC